MKPVSTDLLPSATCPNCWNTFKVNAVKWIAAHDELLDDERLGVDAPQRFRPTHFDVQGNAVDVKGLSCQDLACPTCHLRIPRSVLAYRPFFLSIVGTPSCGKSYYLASMAWQLRKTLPKTFNVLMADSDGECNRILNASEEELFFNPDPSNLAKLDKTDLSGDGYSQVQFGDQSVTYPKPFYFDLRPNNRHRQAANSKKQARLLCVYDNAGESFLPGADTVSNPVTKHLGLAEAWLFCFDPSQDPRLRGLLKGKSADFQFNDSPVTARQETVLNEMVVRIRKHSEMGLKDQSDKPLIVVCTKFDAWSSLMKPLPNPWALPKDEKTHVLNLSNIQKVSSELRSLLYEHSPEVVSSAEAISSQVYFVPVSATGCTPVRDETHGDYRIRTDSIAPLWCEVPVLLALAHRAPKLIRVARASASRKGSGSGAAGEGDQ